MGFSDEYGDAEEIEMNALDVTSDYEMWNGTKWIDAELLQDALSTMKDFKVIVRRKSSEPPSEVKE